VRAVWKYPVEVYDRFTLTMPAGATVLTVQMQHGVPYLWALVDPKATPETRRFRLAGTGHVMRDEVEEEVYVGTFQMSGGGLVFHVFEVTTP